MPSIRIYDGDLLSLMAGFDKLKERMSAAEAVLTTILQAVDTMKDLLLPLSVHVHSVSADTLQKQPVSSHPQSKLDNVSHVRSSVATRAGNNDSAELGNPGRSWAVASEAASTPTTSNRYTVLQDMNDDCAGSDSQSETPFMVHHSRRSIKRRRQQSKLQQQQQQPQPQMQLSNAGPNTRPSNTYSAQNADSRRGRVMLTGKQKSQGAGQKLMAAKRICILY